MTKLNFKQQQISEEGSKTYSYICLLFVFILLGLLSVRTIHNPDFFWHVKVGEDICRNMAVPVYDSYSYHEGLHFFAHEWLFDVIIYGVYSTFGLYGVLLLMQIIGVATSYMIYKNVKLLIGEVTFSVFMCFIIGGLFISSFLIPRPQMISSLLSLIALYLLESWFGTNVSEGDGTSPWVRRYLVLALVSTFWINIHGGSYPIFFILLSGYGLELLIKFLKSRDRADLNRLLRLISVGVCAILSFSINPYGIKMIAFPFLLTGDATTYFIQEWKSPVFRGAIGVYRYLIMAIPIMVMVSSKVRINTRTKWYVSIFSFMALSSGRHISLLILFNYISVTPLLYSIVSGAWNNIIGITKNIFKKPVILLLIITTFTIILNVQIWLDVVPMEWTEYPGEALAYIDDMGLDTNNNVLLNYYAWGGYMILSGHTVFIDGRADVYQKNINPQSRVMNDYIDIIQLVRVEENLEKYNCKYVLQPRDGALAKYLQLHQSWTVLFESEVENSILLVKE